MCVCVCVEVFNRYKGKVIQCPPTTSPLLPPPPLRTHCDDVEEVIVSQRVQDGRDGLPGNGEPKALHAAADVYQDDHILRRCGGLDVPLPVAAVEGDDAMLVRLPLYAFGETGFGGLQIRCVSRKHEYEAIKFCSLTSSTPECSTTMNKLWPEVLMRPITLFKSVPPDLEKLQQQ